MDTTVPGITFDEQGVCSVCTAFQEKVNRQLHSNLHALANLFAKVIKDRSLFDNSDFDCVVGYSGGLDSTALLYILHRYEHRIEPYVIHLDGGWDTDLCAKNIERVISKTGFYMETVKLPADIMIELAKAYMKANVVDIEAPFDHAVMTVLYEKARKLKIKTLLSASNITTEGLMPQSWRFEKGDDINIRDIYFRMIGKELKDFPLMSSWKRIYYRKICHIKELSPLDYLYPPYDRNVWMKRVNSEFGWEDYGGKNYEYRFTRFDKGYMQREKYGFDKVRALYSAQIMMGAITREQALEMMKYNYYDDPIVFEEDMRYFLRRMNMTERELDEYLYTPVRSQFEFEYRRFYPKIIKLLKKLR